MVGQNDGTVQEIQQEVRASELLSIAAIMFSVGFSTALVVCRSLENRNHELEDE